MNQVQHMHMKFKQWKAGLVKEEDLTIEEKQYFTKNYGVKYV